MKKQEKTAPTSWFWQALSATLVIAFIAVSLYAYGLKKKDISISVSEYPHIDQKRHLIPQEDFIVNIQPLRESVRAMVAEFEREGGEVSLYIEFLNTGANISVNPDVYLYPASLTKLPTAMVVMKKIENGEWKLSNELVLLEGDADGRSGDSESPLLEYPVGTRFTIERLLKELLINSDNTASNILNRNLHRDEVAELVYDLGLEDLFTGEGQYSAKEYSRIFRSLYTSSFLKREYSEMILEWLDDAVFNDLLSASIPASVRFPHKYGLGEKPNKYTYADAGIVYLANRPYLIAVMVEGEQSVDFQKQVISFMNEVSREVYEYFSDYEK